MDKKLDNNNLTEDSQNKTNNIYNIYKSSVTCMICKGILNNPVICLICQTPFCKICTLKIKNCPNKCNGTGNFLTGKVNIQEKMMVVCPICKIAVSMENLNSHKDSHSHTDCLLCGKTKLKKTELKLKDCSNDLAELFINQNKDFLLKHSENYSNYNEVHVFETKLKNLELKFKEIEKQKNNLEIEASKQVNQINLMTREIENHISIENKQKTEIYDLKTNLNKVIKEKDLLQTQFNKITNTNMNPRNSYK